MRKSGVEMIRDRVMKRVIDKGHTAEKDDKHVDSELAIAGSIYAMPKKMKSEIEAHEYFPFYDGNYKPYSDRRDELALAGALIAAEIDRLNRVEERRTKDL